jgi:uroporphyrinogen-III decarboxylase
MTLLEERQKRIDDAISLKEPDRVPIASSAQCYPMYNAGYTVADALYDFDKFAEASIKFVTQYEPDYAKEGLTVAGLGEIFELVRPKNVVWPGAPDGRISKNSTQQFIEYAVLHKEDMDFFTEDYTAWLLTKGYPAVAGIFEPLADWDFSRHQLDSGFGALFQMLSTPAAREMMQTIWKISDLSAELTKKTIALGKKYTELGFPVVTGGRALVPFDIYSDFYRGTLDAMMDLYEHPEVIFQFIDRNIEYVLADITRQAERSPGKWLFMPLHKGMDTFLSDEQYKDYYWKYLQRMINHIIDVGMVPHVYTEGPYNTRLKHLADVPKGKVIYSFEEVDPISAKRLLGDTACIQGVFPVNLLHYGTKQQVIDEVKRLIDILAPGGGYMLSTGAGYDQAKPENVEAMFDTVKTYGKR